MNRNEKPNHELANGEKKQVASESQTKQQNPEHTALQHATDEKSASQKLIELLTIQPAMANFVGNVMGGMNPDEALNKCFPRAKKEVNRDLLDEKLVALDVATNEWDAMSERIAKSFEADDQLLELLVKGCNYEKALKSADEKAYIRGRNEKIEMEKPTKIAYHPDDANEDDCDPCHRFLNRPHRSIWDD